MEGETDRYGHLTLTLEEYMQEHNISKNKLSRKANLQRTQLNQYCRNKVQRLDLHVLARICSALNCEVGEIIWYVKPVEEDGRKEETT